MLQGYVKKQVFQAFTHLRSQIQVDYTLLAHDLPALKIAELSDVSRLTINQLLFKLRTRIAQLCDASSPFSGEVEVDESSFGGCRVRGKKGRGVGGKTIVFGILECHGKGYTEIVSNAAKKPLQAAIQGRVAIGISVAHPLGRLEGLRWAGG